MDLIKDTLKWVLPSAKLVYRMMAVSAEVMCRQTFGQRYTPHLIGSFLLAFLYGAFAGVAMAQQPPRWLGVYLLIYFVLVCYHLFRMFRPRILPLHSYWPGQSWPIWRRLPIKPSKVQLLCEPGLVVLLGWVMLPADMALSVWLQLAGLCLFIKELLFQLKQRNRMLDALDARAEGERLNTGIRRQSGSDSGGEQAATPVVPAQAVRAAQNPAARIARNLDPALQRLLSSGNQTEPNPPATSTPLPLQEPRRYHSGPLGALPRITSRQPRPPR